MNDQVEHTSRFVDDLVKGRRPRRFEATPGELEAMHAAAQLRAGAGADLPDPRFVAGLEKKLRRELDPSPVRSPVTRRRLLGTAGAIAVAAVGGAVAERLIQGLGQPGTSAPELAPPGASWRPVVVASAVPDGGAIRFDTGAMAGFIVNRGGHITGVSAVCTHLGCMLQAGGGGRLDCPCHRTSFRLDGSVAEHFLPSAPAPLPHLRVRVREGTVEVFAV